MKPEVLLGQHLFASCEVVYIKKISAAFEIMRFINIKYTIFLKQTNLLEKFSRAVYECAYLTWIAVVWESQNARNRLFLFTLMPMAVMPTVTGERKLPPWSN